MTARYLLALDVGGGSGRCLLLDCDTSATFVAKRDWSHLPAPGSGGLGYDLDLPAMSSKLGEAAREAMRLAGAAPEQVVGIAVTSMRNTTIVLDAAGEVVFAVPNQDARALGDALEWAAKDGLAVHQVTGHWPTPLFTGSRLIWMRAHAPELFERADRVASLSDWVAYSLGARLAAERSQAGETLLFDQREREWAHDLIASLEFDEALFPDPVDAGEVIGALSDEAAARLSLVPGIPIAAGGADTQCALLGAGAVSPGDICVVAGTTMPVQLVTGEFVLDGEGRLWSGQHVIPGLYVLESNGLTTGAVLEWLADIIYADYDAPVQVLFAEAALSEPGGAGVYSTFGACTFDARKLNVPVGNLSMSHMVTPGAAEGRRHVSRSIIEGIAFSARANVEQLLAVSGGEGGDLRVCAGMTASPLWARILSDVTGRLVLVSATPEASALGAAICAGVGAGVFGDLAEGAARAAAVTGECEPGPDSAAYANLYAGWGQACEMRATSDDHLSMLMTMTMLGRAAQEGAREGAGFRPRMLVTASMDDAALAELERIGEVEYRGWREANRIYLGGEELAGALEGCQVFVTEMDLVDYEALKRLPGLRAIAACRVNPVNVDLESATAFGIPVFNTPGRNADAVADLAVGFMVMLARKLPAAASFLELEGGEAGDLMKMGEAYARFQGRELWGKTVGIVGLGSVGRAVARRVRGFGADAVFFDPFVTAGEGARCNARKRSLEALLAESDFVTLHAPASDATRHLMDAAAFALMRPGACFINTARASLVDEDALYAALQSGGLAGAALDVYPVEPPAADDRFVTDGRVITTPHIGGNTVETGAHQGAIVAGQLQQLLAGRDPSHLLNPEVMPHFSWDGPRREPTPGELERLAAKPKPSMTS